MYLKMQVKIKNF